MFGLGQTLQGERPLPGPTWGPDAGLPAAWGHLRLRSSLQSLLLLPRCRELHFLAMEVGAG